jgi:hypothetical protein
MKGLVGCAVLAALAALCTAAGAETIRGISTTAVTLEARADLQPTVNLKAEEFAAITLPGGGRFVRAVMAEILISESLRRYADSFAVAIYCEVSPAPAAGEHVYTGRRVLFQVLPPATRAFVRIPVGTGARPSDAASLSGPESVWTAAAVPADRFPVLVVIQPIMKGIPDSVLERPFFVTFKPEVLSRGVLDLRVRRPQGFTGEPIRVFLDSQPFDIARIPVELDAGVHQLDILSDAFQKETASFAVSAGQTTSLEIELSPAVSYITVDSASGAVVYLDGERLDLGPGQRRQLTEGIHTIRFKIGDTNLSRRIEVRKGRSYHVALALDLSIKEE